MKKTSMSEATKITLQTRVSVFSLLLLLSSFLLPSLSRAEGPMAQVRATVDKVLIIVRNPNLKSEAQLEDLRAQLAQVIYPRFDFTEMARRSLGPYWGSRTPEEQREFVIIFAGLLEKLYVNRLESYGSGEVVYAREVEDTNYAQVDTKIVSKMGEEFSIKYKLHLVNADWKVYDIVVEDISLVNNYRSQFNRVIARSSFADLVHIMKEKQSQGSEKSR